MPNKNIRNKENRGLPARWRYTHGAFYYRVPPGNEKYWDGKKLFRLGVTQSEAYRTWGEHVGHETHVYNVDALLDRYILEVIPEKAPKTRKGYMDAIIRLRSVFGQMSLEDIKPQHIYKYADNREAIRGSGNARVRAKREISVLSHAFTKAVQWGYAERHPFRGEVRLQSEKPRDRYIEDWEIIECLSLPSLRLKGSVKAIQAYIKIKLLTGMRRGDILRLKMENIREDGIHVKTNKTGKPVIYEWSEELRAAVEEAKVARPVHIAPYLFCTKRGKGYLDEDKGEAHGWASMWGRFMKRVLAETKLEIRFTEHDLRAKCASDAETLEHARALLAHADQRTTDRIYRRKPEIVRPLR